MDELPDDADELQPRPGRTESFDTLLLAAARFVQSQGVSVLVVLPRRPGVVNRAREVARGTGLIATARIMGNSISVRLSPG